MSLEEMQEQIERYYIEMENELLLNIAKKLSQGKPMEIDKFDTEKGEPIVGSGGVNEWQLERLKELGGLTEENAKIISKYSGKTVEEVNKVFERARKIGAEVDEKILSLGIKAGILNEINPIIEDITIKNILQKSISTVLSTFNNQNNSLLTSAGREYTDIVNKVSTQVMSGTKTTMKAMQEAVSELAKKGLTGFTARNGAQWTPEAYTKMVLRSNTQNTINQIQEERMQLAGNDYVEISSHLGARPLCSEDQGKIFSLSGNTTPIEDGLGNSIKVYDWNHSSYGKPAGILGINCGHSRYAFVPGISIHREKDFAKKENDQAYKEKQQQRLYERTIRNKKREIEMLKTTNAEDTYIKQKRRQLSDYHKQYLDFLDETGRTRISANEWIGKVSVNINSELKTTTIKKETKSIIKDARNITSKTLQNKTKGVKIGRIDKKYSYYKPSNNEIKLGNNADEYTLIHELGHKLTESFTKEEKTEYNKLVRKKFSSYKKSDFKKIKGSSGKYWVLKDASKFVSVYQTRIYDSRLAFAFNKVNTHFALEYISEGLKYYYKNPTLLKSKDKELYDFIDGVIKDE